MLPSPKKKGKLAMLLEENSSDEDIEPDIQVNDATTQTHDSSKPWLHEFNRYLDSSDELPSGMSLPWWWGVSSLLYKISDISI